MFKRLTLILISTLLLAGQTLRAAIADDESQLVAFAQPQSSSLEILRQALEQETRLVIQQNHVIPGVVVYAHNFGGDEANRLAKDGVLIGSNSLGNYIELQSGNVLLTPESNIVVGTHKGKISIGAGSTVFISESDNDLVIYDLMQTKANQVSIAINKHKVVIEPGRMLVATSENVNDFEKLAVNCHCVNYRNPAPVNTNCDTVKAFMAEFSIASALTTIQPLQRLTISHNVEDKLAVEKLVKAAVVLGEFATSIEPAPQVAEGNNNTVQVADAANNNQ